MSDKDIKYTNEQGITGNLGPGPCPMGPSNEYKLGTLYSEKIDNNNPSFSTRFLAFADDINSNLPTDGINVLLRPSNPYNEDKPDKKITLLEKFSEMCGYTEEDKENEKKLDKLKSSIFNMLKLHVSDDRACIAVDKNKKDPVLQDWVMNLNWKMQTGLISAIRGYDDDIETEDNNDVKSVVKMIRYLVLRNADGSTKFMSKYCLEEDEVVTILVKHVEHCIKSYSSLHWIKHIVMAIDIIMDYHHSSYVQYYWLNVGKKFNTELNRMLTYKIKYV